MPVNKKEDVKLDKKEVERLCDSGVIRDARGLPIYDPNPDMHPYIARGYGANHGEFHRMLSFDALVNGAFTFISNEIIRADRSIEVFPDETDEEAELRNLLEHAYGCNGYTSSMEGGLERLLFHATMKKPYGFSLVEFGMDLVEHERREPEEVPEPTPIAMPAGPPGAVPPKKPAPKPNGFAEDEEASVAGTDKSKAKGAKKPPPRPKAAPGTPESVLTQALLPTDTMWMAPWSVERWVWHKGKVIGVIQYAPTADETGLGRIKMKDDAGTGGLGINTEITEETEAFVIDAKHVYVPLSKCILFQNQAVDGNPEGRSAFRSAYAWVNAKQDTLERDQDAAETLFQGVVIVQETGTDSGPHRTLSKKDGERMKEMLRMLRQRKTNRIVAPFGVELTIDWPGFDIPDMVNRYKYYDYQILMGVLAGILGLDSMAAATKGLSEGMAQVAYHMVEADADEISRALNGDGRIFTGLSKRIADANIPNYKGRIPKLVFSSIRYQDIERLVNTLSKAAQFLLYTPSVKDEVDFRRLARLRPSSEAEITKLREQVAARNGQSEQSNQSLQNQPLKPGSGGATSDTDPNAQKVGKENASKTPTKKAPSRPSK